MSINIYAFDNYTGRINIPKKVGTYVVDIITAGTITQIQELIKASQLFFVFTKLPEGVDFIVKTEDERRVLQSGINFTKRKYTVKAEPESVWYLDKKVDHTVLIGETVTLGATDLGVLLSIFLAGVKTTEESEKKKKEIYIVCNRRNGKELLRTPQFDEAVNLCNKNPCCIVLNRAEEVVYTSNYGKVAIPYNSKTHTARYKAEHFPQNNGIFKIKT